MNCNCKENYIKSLKERIVEKLPEGAKFKSVELEGYGLTFGGGSMDERSISTLKYEYERPTKSGRMVCKKGSTNIFHNYCPFCGKKADKEE